MTKKVWSLLAGALSVLLLSSSLQAYPLLYIPPSSDNTVIIIIRNIRGFDDFNTLSVPQFFMNITMNDVPYVSPVWNKTRYLYDLNWSATLPIADEIETVNITMQLGDLQDNEIIICDISGKTSSPLDNYTVNIVYNVSTGQWTGDDEWGDPSGYGRLNGCDDGSIYQQDRDCELWFDITQTESIMNNATDDPNHDGIPVWWDYHWGYDPFAYDNHSKRDPDNDGLNNYEEYLTSQWGSDPFRQDLFLEIDYMAASPTGEQIILSDGAKELLRDAYDRRNIVYHLDDRCMGGGGEMIPFDSLTFRSEIHAMYQTHFLHNDPGNWRRSVFHYGLIVYNHVLIKGYTFSGDKTLFFAPGVNSFQISSKRMEEHTKNPSLNRDVIYASAIMHETGHSLGIFNVNAPGCDNYFSKYPWQINWWRFSNYYSVMNYRYIFTMVDYSDGSHGRFDHDDWGSLDLAYFQKTID